MIKSTLCAKDIMTPNVKSVPANWTMQKFSAFLSEHDIIGSPVANEKGEIVGIATLKDIADFHFDTSTSDYESQLDEDEVKEARRLRMMIFEGFASMPVEVSDIMTPMLISVDESTPIKEVAKQMMEEHLHRIFVKNNEEVTGIITTHDLLRIIVENIV